jgi:hypothetical protein
VPATELPFPSTLENGRLDEVDALKRRRRELAEEP